MVYASVRDDNRPYRRKTIQKHIYCTSMHLHFVHCEIFEVKQWYINERCNKHNNYSIVLYVFVCEL